MECATTGMRGSEPLAEILAGHSDLSPSSEIIRVQSIEKSRFCSVILFSPFGGTLHLLTLKQASNLVTYRYLSVNIYLAVKSVLFLYRQRGGDKFLKGGFLCRCYKVSCTALVRSFLQATNAIPFR